MSHYLRAENVSLTYRLPHRVSLLRKGAKPVDSRIEHHLRSDNIHALKDVTFTLQSGDRLALIGANGAGKTSLLKVLFGVYTPTSGRVEADGRIDGLFNMGLGFRAEATGRRNIELRGLINGWTPKLIKQHMADIIDFSELGEFIDLPLKSYSAGMAARLAFAIATSMAPEILLMDEWIGVGDENFQLKAQQRMTALAEHAGIVVLASHNAELLKRTCNKVLLLDGGKLAFFGDIDRYAELLRRI